jgi:hypothetical protein
VVSVRVLIGAIVLLGCSPPQQSSAKPSLPMTGVTMGVEAPPPPVESEAERAAKVNRIGCAYDARSLYYPPGDPCAPDEPSAKQKH